MSEPQIIYKEVQHFRNNRLWLIILLAPAAMPVILIWQLITGELFDNLRVSNLSLLFLSVVYLAPAIFVLTGVKFKTIIDEEKISFGWNVPVSDLNVIMLSEVKELNVIRYRFVGYGYRQTRLYGTTYNVRGDMGLQVATKDGEKILIGTSRPEEMKKAVEKINLT